MYQKLDSVAVDQARARMRGVLHIERHGFVAHAVTRALERGNVRQQIPGAFVMVGGQHPAAAQGVGAVLEQRAVEAAADQRLRLVDHDIAPRQLGVANQERRARERSDATTNEIRLHDLPRLQFHVRSDIAWRGAGKVALDQAGREAKIT
jgi:hypothetical protein